LIQFWGRYLFVFLFAFSPPSSRGHPRLRDSRTTPTNAKQRKLRKTKDKQMVWPTVLERIVSLAGASTFGTVRSAIPIVIHFASATLASAKRIPNNALQVRLLVLPPSRREQRQ
jgi:hypothetical protein